MWATQGRFRIHDPVDDAVLTRTTEALAEGASQIPGHIRTRLLATERRDELFCVSTFTLASSAATYARVLQEHPETVAAGYRATMIDFVLIEELAAFPPDAESGGGAAQP